MTPKKCMSIAKSLTDTQHMELEPLCSVTCQLLVVFPAVFDQFSGRFSKEDNSDGFSSF